MKRILCILSSLDAGGAETFLMKVLRSVSPEEYQFDFVVSHAGGVYSNEVLERGGRIYTVSPRKKNFFRAFRDIKRIVSKNKYRYVLKLGDSPVVSLDLLAARMGGAKHLSFRSCNALTGLSTKQKVINTVMRPFLNFIADVRLAPSKNAAEFTFGKRYARSKVYIIHNGVDLNLYHFYPCERKDVRKEFGVDNKFVVGHVGRFRLQKNHQYLLEIFKAILQQRNDAVLLLVGVGELEEQIRARVAELGLQDHVIFAGQRFDIPQVLSAMDVFVFPSFHEGMPNTVIEAQATGLPCVIADTITREADLTGLVHYLPLTDTPECWAKKALSVVTNERKDTSSEFTEQGYNIHDVAKELVGLIFD